MQNPETGSGGMLVGTVEEVGPESPLGLRAGDRVATLVSLTLTPLVIEDGLRDWDGLGEQVPCDGYAVLFGRSIAAVIPDDLPADLSLSVMDVCGAPALTARVVEGYARGDARPTVAVIGGGGKSGSLSLAAARRAGAGRTIGVVPHEREAAQLREAGLADEVVIADARNPIGLRDAVTAAGGPADVTVVCVDVPGCEGGAILATADRGTVIFFSMATSFSAAALGAEGLAADVTMLVGTGYTPGHAAYALELLRDNAGVRRLFEAAPGARGAGVTRVLLRNGVVPDGRPGRRATALAVEDGRIVFTGDEDAARAYENADEVVDLEGALVTPAFVDSHVHTVRTGFALTGLDLAGTRSLAATLDALAAHALGNDGAGVLVGQGWDETDWPERRPPTGDELERAAPGTADLPHPRRRTLLGGLAGPGRAGPGPGAARRLDADGRVERDAHHAVRATLESLIGPDERLDAARAACRPDGRPGHRRASTRTPRPTSGPSTRSTWSAGPRRRLACGPPSTGASCSPSTPRSGWGSPAWPAT